MLRKNRNNTYFKKFTKSSKISTIPKLTGQGNCSLYYQQAGEDDDTNRVPKPAHERMVEPLAKLLATFQGL